MGSRTALILGFLCAALALMPSSTLAQGGTSIPIQFTLAESGRVTIVIEDAAGRRVRNLVQDTSLSAGLHTVNWDGMTNGTVVNRTSNRTPYDIAPEAAPPGVYHVRAIRYDPIRMKYEFSVQSPGNPPWSLDNDAGAWFGDHGTPSDIVYLPDGSPHADGAHYLITSTAGESNKPMMWMSRSFEKIAGGKLGLRGGQSLAIDRGSNPVPEHHAYAVWEKAGKTRVWIIDGVVEGEASTTQVYQYNGSIDLPREEAIGLAAYNGKVAFSIPPENKIIFLATTSMQASLIQEVDFSGEFDGTPKGLHATADGTLYVLTATKVVRYDNVDWAAGTLGTGVEVVGGLKDPRQMSIGDDGNLYVSDWGDDHQVKVFSPAGALLRTIGNPGGQQIGTYADEERMHFPFGLSMHNDTLVVTEMSYAPKRISLWKADGTFIRAIYGPPKYGGGGVLDPANRSRFYYAGVSQENDLGVEFELDWVTGEAKPSAIYALASANPYSLDLPCTAPTIPLRDNGQLFLACMEKTANENTKGVGIWRVRNDGVAVPVAAVGTAVEWRELDRPELGRPSSNNKRLIYTWADLNGNLEADPGEVEYKDLGKKTPGSWYVARDFSLANSAGVFLDAPQLTDIAVYDLTTARFGVDHPNGVGSAIRSTDGWFINTNGPFHGYKDGELQWTYHSQWPNRTANSVSPIPEPDFEGELIDTGRIIGQVVFPDAGDAGGVWGIMGNRGSVYLFTTDGYYITDLGCHRRLCDAWNMPFLNRGDLVPEDLSFRFEHWWPSMTQIEETGDVYMAVGFDHTSIVELVGLESIERLDLGTISLNVSGNAPQLEDDEATAQAGAATTIDVLANDSDPDGDALVVDRVSPPQHGTAVVSSDQKKVVYTPETGFLGEDTFIYTAADGNGWLVQATVTVTVVPESGNSAPLAAADTVAAVSNVDTFIRVLDNDTDANGDALVVTNVTDPAHGTAIIIDEGTRVRYAPNKDYLGADSFDYTISDGNGGNATATVVITVVALNSPPVAEPDVVFATSGTPETFDVLANDSDENDDALRVVAVTEPSHGTAEIVEDGAQVRYTPDDGYVGTDSFSYTVGDGNGGTATADVNITVQTSSDTDLEGPPTATALRGTYPNPFSTLARVRYDLAEHTTVEVTIYDMLGREVIRLVDYDQAPGRYEATWDGEDKAGRLVASGVYLVRVRAGSYARTTPLTFVK